MDKINPQSYREKSIEVLAMRLTKDNHEQLAQWCGGFCESYMINPPKFCCLHVKTSEGEALAFEGDMIVKDSLGFFHVYKSDIFTALFEEVSDE